MSEENNKNIADSSPGLLISEIQNSSLTKPIIMATIIHIVLIGIFSIGYLNMCIKHKTMSPKAAIAEANELKAEKELEAKRKKKADAAAVADKPKTTDASKTAKTGDAERVPQVIKDTQEVIKEKPKAPSSLNSFDDDL
jgi:sortase (surface protein transpeptidase)